MHIHTYTLRYVRQFTIFLIISRDYEMAAAILDLKRNNGVGLIQYECVILQKDYEMAAAILNLKRNKGVGLFHVQYYN